MGCAIVSALAVLALSATGAAGQRDRAPTAGDGKGGVKLRSVGSFDSPIYVTSAPGFDDLLFVVERDGRIEVLRDGKRAGTFLDITDRVSTDGERGLLSVAFSPDYESSRRFYVYYTDPNGDIEVDEFRRSADSPIRADASARTEIVTIPHPNASNHNGGTAAFGPDGNLYIATGDGGASSSTAQNRSSLLGKLLRLDPDRPGDAEIVAVGLRNPFRFSFDSRKPLLAIGDVGASSREEINYLRFEDARNANFGWNVFEGNQHHSGNLQGAHSAPMFDYANDSNTCAVTGGVTVHDKKLKSLKGRYVFADVCEGKLRSFKPRLKGNDARGERRLGVSVDQPVGFGEDRDGHVYVASLSGKVYRLAPKG